jgi:hypothetical protein
MKYKRKGRKKTRKETQIYGIRKECKKEIKTFFPGQKKIKTFF